MTLLRDTLNRRCANCAHYGSPGMITAYCDLGPPDWMGVPERGSPRWPNYHPSASFVAAGNVCDRFEWAEHALPTASGSTCPPIGEAA